MSTAVAPRTTFRTLADLWDRLGNVPMDRIRMTPLAGTATRNDLLEVVSRRGGGRLCELVAGTLVEKTVGRSESTLAMWLGGFLAEYLRVHPIGQMTGPDGAYDTTPDQVRMPDVGFVLNDRIIDAEAEDDAILRIPPDLAVEIISQGNTRKEMDTKLHEYFEAGVRLVWYVDPRQRTVRVFTSPEGVRELTEADTLDGGDVLPGFELSIEEWFRRAEVEGMTTEAQSILEDALRLPEEIRAEIAERLLDSIDEDRPIAFDAETLQEAKRRLAEMRSGKVVGVPAEDVIAAAKTRSSR